MRRHVVRSRFLLRNGLCGSSQRRSLSAQSGAQKPRRVVVTGLGLVTPLGTGTEVTWRRLVAGETGVAAIGAQHPEIAKMDLPAKVAAFVRRSSAKDGGGRAKGEFDPEEWVPKAAVSTASPFVQYAMSAASQALSDSGWSPSSEDERDRSGVAIGSGIGSVEDSSEAGLALYTKGHKKVSPYAIPRFLVNLAGGQVSIQHGLRGPNHAVSTACTTGAHSIGDAYRFIKYGDADVMVAGGTEASVTPMSISLFSRIRALSTKFNDRPAEASRPFDAQRDGFVMGEGAGVLLLEELGHALARNARIYAEVLGYGLSGDAHHITQPSSDGRGAYMSMRNALRNAGVEPHEVGYVNAHATSTPLGDSVEAKALRRLFGDHCLGKNGGDRLLVSSTKGAVGHMLGAAGAVEAAFCVLALRTGSVPPTLNLTAPDAACAELDCIPLKARHLEPGRLRVALTNSFGFGGTNASLVLRRWEPKDKDA